MNEPFKWKTFIEPISFLVAFSFGLSETVLTDEILSKTCRKILGENSTDCSSLSSLTALQELVQPSAATILALKSFIENFIPAIVCIFFGCWSDTIGRKPILLTAVTGTVIYYASLALLSYLNVDAYWYLAISFFASFLGGFPMVVMACYIYASDIVNCADKCRRLNFVDLAVFAGKLAGCLAYPSIVQRFGHWVAYTISSYVCLLALIFTGFSLRETLHLQTPNESANDPLNVGTMVGTVQKFFQWLSLYSRDFLGFALLVIALHDDNIQGTSTTLFLYVQQFQWTLSDFSVYTAAYFVATAVALLVISSKFLSCIHDKKILTMAIGLISSLASSFTRAFAKSSTALYAALGVGAFSWIPQYFNWNAVIDIEVMPKEDFCKGLTATTALERIALSFIIPLNIYLCTNFITTYPHPVWLMQLSLQLLAILLMCGVFIRDLIFMLRNDD